MRSTRPLHFVAASLLLLAACGDDSDDQDIAGFCREVESVDQQLGDSADLQARADALGGIDPPSDIADDWTTMVSLMPEIAEANAGGTDSGGDVDPTELEALQELEERIVEFDVAVTNVERYLAESCDIAI